MKYLIIIFLFVIFSPIFTQYAIDNSAIGVSGGSQSNLNFSLHHISGQPTNNVSSNGDYLLQEGFIYLMMNGVALSAEPNAHSNVFLVDSVLNSGSIRFEVQPANEIGAKGYVVLARVQSTPAIFLTDGFNYNLHSVQSSTKVVAISYEDNAQYIVSSGLLPNKIYTFALVPFNWDGSNNASINYKTDGQIPTLTQTTPIPTLTEWALIILGLTIPLIAYIKMKS